MTAVQGGAFGKLPTTADFVRHNAAAPEVRTFDAWLEEGIVLARQTLGAAWQDAYDRAPPCRFVFQPRDGQNALVGVTVPGIDAAGRRFPFSVFRFLDRRDATNSWRDLPLALDEFLAAAERVAVEASRYSWSRERVREETDGLLRTGADDFARARERYQSFARETTFGALLGALPGVSGETAPGRTLQGLREVLRAVVTSGRGGWTFGLRAPLPPTARASESGGGEAGSTRVAPAVVASFWMDLVARSLGTGERPAVVLSVPGSPGEGGRLFLVPASPRFLGSWLAPGRESDYVWDLVPGPSDLGESVRDEPDERDLVRYSEAALEELLDGAFLSTR